MTCDLCKAFEVFLESSLLRENINIFRDKMNTLDFPGSVMGRHLLSVTAHCGKVGTYNLHLASWIHSLNAIAIRSVKNTVVDGIMTLIDILYHPAKTQRPRLGKNRVDSMKILPVVGPSGPGTFPNMRCNNSSLQYGIDNQK